MKRTIALFAAFLMLIVLCTTAGAAALPAGETPVRSVPAGVPASAQEWECCASPTPSA